MKSIPSYISPVLLTLSSILTFVVVKLTAISLDHFKWCKFCIPQQKSLSQLVRKKFKWGRCRKNASLKIFVIVIPKEWLAGEALPILPWMTTTISRLAESQEETYRVSVYQKKDFCPPPRLPILLLIWQQWKSLKTFFVAHDSYRGHSQDRRKNINPPKAHLWN